MTVRNPSNISCLLSHRQSTRISPLCTDLAFAKGTHSPLSPHYQPCARQPGLTNDTLGSLIERSSPMPAGQAYRLPRRANPRVPVDGTPSGPTAPTYWRQGRDNPGPPTPLSL